MHTQFTFSQFLFELQTLEPLELPAYKGSTLRGSFGHAFKKVVCALRTRTCADCLLSERCVYCYVFETPSPAALPESDQFKTAPHPFVILPPLEEKTYYAPGEPLAFTLTLIGRALEYLPYFIYTFYELGATGMGRARGRFALKRVLRCNGEARQPVYESEGKILKPAYDPLSWQQVIEQHPCPTPTTMLTLRFLTPTRMKVKDDLVVHLDFSIFFKSLVRRIEALGAFHCGGMRVEGVKELIHKAAAIETAHSALSWHDWERYSNRQETRMKLGGLVGTITFRGDLTPFVPFMVLGEYIHVGKGTSFGLGKYEIAKLPAGTAGFPEV